MQDRASKALRLAGRLLLGLGVFLVALELGLRLLARLYPSPLLAVSSAAPAEVIRAWRGRPGGSFNGWTLNSLGLFDAEFALPRSPGTFRIVALADSFGVGVVPYGDNFLTLLDRILDEGQPTEIYNFGVPNLGPAEYLHLFRTEAAAYEPDLVLLCFFVGNDIELREPPSLMGLEPLYSVAVLGRLSALLRTRPDLELEDDTAPTFSRQVFRSIELARLRFALERAPDPETAAWLERSYAGTAEILRQIHREVGERLRVVLIPDEYQVSERLLNSLLEGLPDPSACDPERPSRLLGRLLRSEGIEHLDLLPALRAAEREGRTYKPRDTHWNRRGNRVAADALAPWLQGQIEQLRE